MLTSTLIPWTSKVCTFIWIFHGWYLNIHYIHLLPFILFILKQSFYSSFIHFVTVNIKSVHKDIRLDIPRLIPEYTYSLYSSCTIHSFHLLPFIYSSFIHFAIVNIESVHFHLEIPRLKPEYIHLLYKSFTIIPFIIIHLFLFVIHPFCNSEYQISALSFGN